MLQDNSLCVIPEKSIGPLEAGGKMFMGRQLWLSFCLIVSIVGGGTTFAAPGVAVPEETQRKIVIFHEDARHDERHGAVQQHGGAVRHSVPHLHGLAVDMPAASVQALRRHRRVKEIHDDLQMKSDSGIVFTPVPPPSSESYSWGQMDMQVNKAHTLLATKQLVDVRVAIVDTGLDLTHPELQSSIVDGYNAMSGANPNNYQDDNGHGTHMAGIIAAKKNAQGIIGIASRARLVGVKVLDATGHGYLSDLLNGLEWVRTHNVRVVNMSLSFDETSPLLQAAVQSLNATGITLVASAGNKCTVTTANDSGGDDSGGDDSGGDTTSVCTGAQDPLQGGVKYPARYPEVISVGATDSNNQVTTYSRSGPELDVVAPGGSTATQKVLSTLHGSRYAYGSGTSQATAHVTGAIAALLQMAPNLSVAQVRELLLTTTEVLPNTPSSQQGAGLANLDDMLEQQLNP